MPKKDFEKMGKELVKSAIKQTGLPRREVADQLGVTLGALDKWIAKGRIPKDQLQNLERIKVEGGSALIQANPILGSNYSQSGQSLTGSRQDLHTSATLAEQSGRRDLGIFYDPANPKTILTHFEAEDLVDALQKKGWVVSLKRREQK